MLSPCPSNPYLKSMGNSSLTKQCSSPPSIPASHLFCYTVLLYSPHTGDVPVSFSFLGLVKSLGFCRRIPSSASLNSSKKIIFRQHCDALGISFVPEHCIQRECGPVSLVAYYIGDTSHRVSLRTGLLLMVNFRRQHLVVQVLHD